MQNRAWGSAREVLPRCSLSPRAQPWPFGDWDSRVCTAIILPFCGSLVQFACFRRYDIEVVSSKGEVVWSKQHESVGPAEQTTTFDLASEIPSLEPGEWAVRTRIGGSAPVDTPFVIAPPSVDDVLWEDVGKYFDFEQVCAHSHGEDRLLVGLHHCKLLPPCAEMEWSTLRMGLNLTLT